MTVITMELSEAHDFGKGEVAAHKHPRGGGWVAETAKVDDTCYVGPYASVFGNAVVAGNVRIDGYSKVYDNAVISDNVIVNGDAQIYDRAKISKNARIGGKAKVYGNALITDFANVYDDAEVFGNAMIRNESEVYDQAKAYGDCVLISQTRLNYECHATRQPIVLTGMNGKDTSQATHATFTDNHIVIGCVVLPPSIWETRGKRLLKALGYDEETCDTWITTITTVSKLHKCKDREGDVTKLDEQKIVERVMQGETQDRMINRNL